LIKLGIEKSELAIVINTKTFAKGDWTKIELDPIRKKDVPWIQVMRGGAEQKCDDPPIFSRNTEVVVQEILRRRARRT
jgi:hypothetical protein